MKRDTRFWLHLVGTCGATTALCLVPAFRESWFSMLMEGDKAGIHSWLGLIGFICAVGLPGKKAPFVVLIANLLAYTVTSAAFGSLWSIPLSTAYLALVSIPTSGLVGVVGGWIARYLWTGVSAMLAAESDGSLPPVAGRRRA